MQICRERDAIEDRELNDDWNATSAEVDGAGGAVERHRELNHNWQPTCEEETRPPCRGPVVHFVVRLLWTVCQPPS